MANLYNHHLTESHTPSEFIQRCNTLYDDEDHDGFLRAALTGEFTNDGAVKQIYIDIDRHYLHPEQETRTLRDIDSAIGISRAILVDGPLSIWAAPHTGHELKSSIHLTYPDLNEGNGVPYHKIPNFELGTFGTRHAINVFFPKLWSKERGGRSRPHLTTECERSFWYKNGLRKAVKALGTGVIASEWPATLETERLRAKKKNRQVSWGTKMLDKWFVSLLADQIRQEIGNNLNIDPEDKAWAGEFFFIHMIRGVKHAYIHEPDSYEAENCLHEFFQDAQLADDAFEHGEWWIDVGIEVSSDDGMCLQWATSAHSDLVQLALGVDQTIAKKITRMSCSKYERDPAGHFPDLSGFRLTPGKRGSGDNDVAYLQVYTTDKSVVYNTDSSHHAKFLSAKEVLSQTQPCLTINGLHTIYGEAREHNPSKARLEIRVPYHFAAEVLVDVDDEIIRDSLCAFTGAEWWNLRLIRLMACSQVLSLQAKGASDHRFMPETLLLTATCIWLVNSLHSRPEDGPAARELMRAVLPLTEADNDILETAAYNPNRRAEWLYNEDESDDDEPTPRLPYHPYGYFFLRRIMLETNGVPRMRAGGPGLSLSSFQFWFDGMTLDEVSSRFQRSGIVSREAVRAIRSTTNKRPTVEYISVSGRPEPNIFNFAVRGFELSPVNEDDGSDLEDRDTPPPNLQQDIDSVVSRLWRQMVADIKSKSPNQQGGTNPSYMRLNEAQRRDHTEDVFRHLRLNEVFNAVWYKQATRTQWKTSFDWLLPPIGRKTTSSVQNYLGCRYYTRWMRLQEANVDNPAVLNAIRDDFWTKIREWSWIPNLQSDKMWLTSVKPRGNRGFTRWPENPTDGRVSAPHIYIHSQSSPTFEDVEQNHAEPNEDGMDWEANIDGEVSDFDD